MTPEERNQSAFDRAVSGVISQGGAAYTLTGKKQRCLYRGKNGCRCAIGWLISDEHYRPSFEGSTVDELAKAGFVHPDLSVELLQELQANHDDSCFNGSVLRSNEEFLHLYILSCRSTAATYELNTAAMNKAVKAAGL